MFTEDQTLMVILTGLASVERALGRATLYGVAKWSASAVRRLAFSEGLLHIWMAVRIAAGLAPAWMRLTKVKPTAAAVLMLTQIDTSASN